MSLLVHIHNIGIVRYMEIYSILYTQWAWKSHSSSSSSPAKALFYIGNQTVINQTIHSLGLRQTFLEKQEAGLHSQGVHISHFMPSEYYRSDFHLWEFLVKLCG